VILSAEEKVAAEKLHALTTRLLFLKYEMENAKKLGIHAPRMAWFKKRRSLEQALDKMHSVLRQSEWKIPEELDSCGEGMRTHHEDFSKCAKGTHKHFQKYLEAATIEGAGSLTIEGAGSTAHAHREPVQVSTSNVHHSWPIQARADISWESSSIVLLIPMQRVLKVGLHGRSSCCSSQ
jgi:hypothetical protein